MSFSSNEKTEAEKAAEAWGIDLKLLEAQLELSPQERIESHQRALELIHQLQEAGQRAGYRQTT